VPSRPTLNHPLSALLVHQLPHDHWKTLTFIAALRHNRFDAPCIIDGPINGDLFAAYVEQLLLPTRAPGDDVILGNIGSNKGQRARRAIRGAGAHILTRTFRRLAGSSHPYWIGLI
jgi:transposase